MTYGELLIYYYRYGYCFCMDFSEFLYRYGGTNDKT